MKKKPEMQNISLKLNSKIVDTIEKELIKYNMPRSAWITQAIVERLERIGYEVEF